VKDRTRPSLPPPYMWPALLLGLGAVVFAVAALSVYYVNSRPSSLTEEGIRKFTESYFAVWSKGDMAAYREHFTPAARIAYVQDGAVVKVLDRDPFVDQQTEAVTKASAKMTERMTSFAVNCDGTAAQVTADWELKRGNEISVGVDRFTLIRAPDGLWKIAFLLFYEHRK
jgi:hypothetical protein